MKTEKLWITGIVPAVFTPMHVDGSLNLELVPAIVEFLLEEEVSAVYVCGSTGEGPSLSTQERMQVTEAYTQAVAGRCPVIVQVGHNSLEQANRLAMHAQDIGAQAISAIPPSYFKAPSTEILVECFVEITRSAPDLPFFYYHIPRLSGMDIDMVQFLQLGRERIPSLVGMKYSDSKIYELQACADLEDGRYNILFGLDEMVLSGFVGGAHGAVGSSYNFAAPLYNRIYAQFGHGNINAAQNLQSLSVRMINILNKYSPQATNAPTMKAMMKLIGLDCGPMRLPQANITSADLAAMRSELDSIGFFDWGRH